MCIVCERWLLAYKCQSQQLREIVQFTNAIRDRIPERHSPADHHDCVAVFRTGSFGSLPQAVFGRISAFLDSANLCQER